MFMDVIHYKIKALLKIRLDERIDDEHRDGGDDNGGDLDHFGDLVQLGITARDSGHLACAGGVLDAAEALCRQSYK